MSSSISISTCGPYSTLIGGCGRDDDRPEFGLSFVGGDCDCDCDGDGDGVATSSGTVDNGAVGEDDAEMPSSTTCSSSIRLSSDEALANIRPLTEEKKD